MSASSRRLCWFGLGVRPAVSPPFAATGVDGTTTGKGSSDLLAPIADVVDRFSEMGQEPAP